jgi:hypothetical protein
MCPVQVIHICDVCGASGLRQDMRMGKLAMSYDGHLTLEAQLVCPECNAAIMEAIDMAWRERSAK